MKFIFNNFIHILSRFKTSAFLNVLGLSVAFAVFMVIAIQLYYNFSYNRNFENTSNIYSFRRYYPSDDISVWTISVPVAEKMANEFSEIKNYCLIQRQGDGSFHIVDTEQNTTTHRLNMYVATAGFLDILKPEILRGDASRVFEDTDKVMISEKKARSMFGDNNPVGQVIYENYSQMAYTIVAVYKDFPDNCSIDNGVYKKLTAYNDINWGYQGFFELMPGSYDKFIKKLNGARFRGEETLKQQDLDPSTREDYALTPLLDVYMMRQPELKTVSLSLLVISILVLIIAYINFFNFSIAVAPARIKNFNIHKILGCNKATLKLSIVSEGIFISLIAILLGILFVYFFSTTPLVSLFTANISPAPNLRLICIVALSFVVLSVLMSLYPSHYVTSMKENITLNTSFSLSPKGSRLRNVLITFQYIAAIVLISVSLFIKVQQEFMKNYSIGIEKENIVYFSIYGLKTDTKTFVESLSANPQVIDYTLSGDIPGYLSMSWNRNFEGKFLQNIYAWPVSDNFLDFFGIDIIAGQNFTKKDTLGLEQIIFNKRFLEKYDFDEGIVGKSFFCFNEGTIMGIASDINFKSLRSPIEPMAFAIVNDQKNWIDYLFIKISEKDITQTISYIEDTWKKYSDDEFKLTFLDSSIDEMYKLEEKQSQLIGIFGLVIIIIAVMGIYGLIVFNTRYKEKEIGIRKINGATEAEIVLMLNKNLMFLLLIAFIIAVPLAYYTIGKWLDNFAYKSAIPWWLFPAAGVLVLIISVITISWQSWRAATANPVDALKNE